ncbi:type II secretion system ATPase GspE [Neptuniibacter sp. CAU 1671]|uniref:type II secretion system ATPase GspE n=1 Tax=Neptuniibacter sp. CAU 1671 TaxID=3032593 RepID=UPI0023D98E36|nr:type II secretion system ATPase GspE [Neptuniibacter sp. CAU 1671]MDF2180738.1 type II secretion system ATPase GspE [Neptuniibacter sp. CAU 1671]
MEQPSEQLHSAEYQQLGQALVQAGCLSGTDLQRVLQMEEVKQKRSSLSNLLVRLGLVSETNIATHLAELLDLPKVEPKDFPPVALLPDTLSYRFLKDTHVLPLNLDDQTLVLAMADPQDQFAVEAVELASGYRVQKRVALATELDNAIEKLYGQGTSQMGNILAGVSATEASDDEEDIEHLKDMASEAPVIRLVNLIMQRAVESRASDIHIEPFEDCLKVRYRIDGVLQEGEAPPVKMSPAVISRIKIMSRLNIAERRLPQDGRIEMRLQGKDLDIRVSTVPTMHGESVVMRLLDRETVSLDFRALGLDEALLKKLYEVLSIPHGMLVVTGPTGSGKTTTLYTALSKLNTEQSKLITVEDPVEYQLPGINQIQVKPSIGLNFAGALRAIVRQDPDVIMVGEMRDLETARICVQSALTGHIVLSTLHTNDAASSVTRLLEMGVEDYLLTSTLNAAIGQRLVRRLCMHCREPYTPLPEIVEELGLKKFSGGEPITLYSPKGCEHCGGSGYRGRVAIIELLIMNDTLRKLVMSRSDSGTIHAAAREAGMRTMYEDGCLKALQGLTSIEDVIRVTQES